MAPVPHVHKGAPAPPQKEDSGYFGVFVAVHAPQLRIKLASDSASPPSAATGPGLPSDPALWPEVHLEVAYPGGNQHLVGPNVRLSPIQDGIYVMNFSQKFKTEPTMEALHELLNNPLTLELRDTPTSTLLASATVDLLPFALGESCISLPDLSLQIDAAAAEAAAAAAAARPSSQSKRGNSGRGRNPGPPALPRFASEPVLSGLSLELTRREPPEGSTAEAALAAAVVPASAPSVATSGEGLLAGKPPPPGPPKGGKAAGKAGDQHPDTTIDESMLPPFEPFRYLPEGVSDPASLNVMELVVDGPNKDLPPGLLGANEAAGGRLFFSAGVPLPAPCPPMVLQGGTLHKEEVDGGHAVSISWPGGGRLRHVLKPEAVQAILSYLDHEGQLCLELARFMEMDKALLGDTEAAWNAYHGCIPLPQADCLLEGSTLEIGEAGVVEGRITAWDAGVSAPNSLPSALPAYTPPPGKFKPIEEIGGPPSTPNHDRKAGKAGLQERPSVPVEPGGKPAAPFSAWAAAGTSLRLGLRFARTLLPAWEPPSPPAKKLQDVIPQRDLNPPPPPVTCEDEFRSQVSSLLGQLAEAYYEANTKNGQLQPQVDPHASPLEANKQLIRSLNKSGQYMAMRERLKSAVVRTVQERFLRSGNMSPNEMGETYGPLYAHLCGITHSVINRAADDFPAPLPDPEPAPSPAELAALATHALEAEASGDSRRTATLMRRRLLDTNNAQVHVEAASVAARCGHHAYALSLFHTAIEIDPTHAHALSAASMLHLDAAVAAAASAHKFSAATKNPWDEHPEDISGDAYTHWNAALACADALLSTTQGSSEAWVVLALVHGSSNLVEGTEGALEASSGHASTYVGLGGSGNYGKCITELKRRVRLVLKAQHKQAAESALQQGPPASLPAHPTQESAQQEKSSRGAGLEEGAGDGTGDASNTAEGAASSVPQQADGSAPPAAAPAAAAATVAEGGVPNSVADSSTASHPGLPASPAAACGVLGVWQLLADLGLRGLADQVHKLATTVFHRACSLEPLALTVATARTHTLPRQPHSRLLLHSRSTREMQADWQRHQREQRQLQLQQQRSRAQRVEPERGGEGHQRGTHTQQDGEDGGVEGGLGVEEGRGSGAEPRGGDGVQKMGQVGGGVQRVEQAQVQGSGSMCHAGTDTAQAEEGAVGEGERGQEQEQEQEQQSDAAGAAPDAGAAPESAHPSGAEVSADDIQHALRSLRAASRMAAAAVAQYNSSSVSPGVEGSAPNAEAAHEYEQRQADGQGVGTQGGAESPGGLHQQEAQKQRWLDLRPLLLMGDVLWMAAERVGVDGPEEGEEAAAGTRTRERAELRRQARCVYQSAVEVAAEAASQGRCYGPDGSPPNTQQTRTASSNSPAASNPPVSAPVQASAPAPAALNGGNGQAGKSGSAASVAPWLLVRAHLRLSQSFLEDEDQAQCAVDVCAAAIACWPCCAAVWKGAAVAAQAKGDAATARAAWAQANILDTEDGQAWAALASLDLREGRKHEAAAAIEKALALTAAVHAAPETSTASPAADAGALLVEAAVAASSVGELYEANMWLTRALSSGYYTFEVYKQLATVQAGRRDLLHARESVAAAAGLAQSASEKEALSALQQSTSFESHMQQCAIGVGS